MQIQVVGEGTRTVVEGLPATPLLQRADDVVELIGTCFEQQARSVLLYPENLPARFFDLSSGEAGTILQKLRNYQMRLAVVEAPGTDPHSTAFQALMREEMRDNYFHIFADRDAALTWLVPEQN